MATAAAPISTAHLVRGIYAREDECAEFLKGGIPTFETSAQCNAFLRAHCESRSPQSNPDRPHMTQLLTTLVNWGQVERYLLQARAEYSARFPPRPRRRDDRANAWADDVLGAFAAAEIDLRLDAPFHGALTPDAVETTLRYLFEHMRSGIYVMIRAGAVRMFVPFCNETFENAWGASLKIEGNQKIGAYYDAKRAAGARKEHVLPDPKNWWANGNIVCNEHSQTGQPLELSQLWGDRFVASLRHMLDAACDARSIGDCEFFLNKRDYPHVKYDAESGEAVEPYGFLVDRDDRDPAADVSLPRRFRGARLAPVVSFYCSARFADLPFPTSEDWEAAIGVIVPPSFDHTAGSGGITLDAKPRDLFTEAKFRQFERPWADKAETAFFRGTATGGGVTPDRNQRLHLAATHVDWSPANGAALAKREQLSPAEQAASRNAREATPLLDAKLTGWNRRDKKVHDAPMTHIRDSEFPFSAGRMNFTPIYEQSAYKYLLYVEGHCAACRYGFMMRLNSVILKVESKCVADSMWFFPLLRPYVDHVPVRADLSDLADKIRWCRANDGACRAIAAAAAKLYDGFLHRDGLLDYVQLALNKIADRYRYPAAWLDAPRPRPLCPVLGPPARDCVDGDLCARCREDESANRADAARVRAEDAPPSPRSGPARAAGRKRNLSSYGPDASKKKRAPGGAAGGGGADASLRARMKRRKQA